MALGAIAGALAPTMISGLAGMIGSQSAAKGARRAQHQIVDILDDARNTTLQQSADKRMRLQNSIFGQNQELDAGLAQFLQGLQPRADLADTVLPQLQQQIDDPGSAIRGNSLFQQLADQATQRTFANQAARGKLGSGETPEALFASLMGVAQPLEQQQFQRRAGLFDVGSGALDQQLQAELLASGQRGQLEGQLQTGLGQIKSDELDMIKDFMIQQGNARAARSLATGNISAQNAESLGSLGSTLLMGGMGGGMNSLFGGNPSSSPYGFGNTTAPTFIDSQGKSTQYLGINT